MKRVVRCYYKLSKPMDIKIQMYNIWTGDWKKDCPANSSCGKVDLNKIEFNKEQLNGYEMSAGVYFYLFIYEGRLLAVARSQLFRKYKHFSKVS